MTKIFIQKIELKNFKSFKIFELELSDELTIITGENGTGKTNLLDAIRFMFEYEKCKPANVISKGENFTNVKIVLSYNDKIFSIQKQITLENIQSYFFNDKEISVLEFRNFLHEQGLNILPIKIYDNYDGKLNNSDAKKFANEIVELSKDIQHLVTTHQPELYLTNKIICLDII